MIDNRRKKTPDAWMPLWVGDYLADTPHLTTEQHGAYLLLLMAYWRRGGPLPADNARLASITKTSAQKWRTLRSVMLEFFTEDGGEWRNKRADQEIARAAASHDRRVSAGQKGAEVRHSKPSIATAKPVAMPVAIAQQSQSHIRTITDGGGSSLTLKSNPEIQNQVDSLLVRAEPEPQPPSIPKPAVSKPSRGSRWPAGQTVPDEWIASAANLRAKRSLPVIDLVLEAEKFTNYWTAKSGASATKVDWPATWRMWALNAYGAKANGRSRQHGAGGSIFDHALGPFGGLGDELAAGGEIPADGRTIDHGPVAH